MKVLFNIIFLIILISLSFYLLLPIQPFPQALNDSLVSLEPADQESPDRRGYFTDFGREDVISHYKNQFSHQIYGFKLYPVRLNYPPEESGTLIRDQTRSTFLEELVFPLRESVYISGFEPKEDKDAIVVNEKNYRQKIIVRHVESSNLARYLIGISSLIYSFFLIKSICDYIVSIKGSPKKK